MMRSIKNLLVFFLATTLAISCGDDDEVSFVLQDVSAPTNLDAVFDIAQDDSGQVSVTPTGVGASIFEVYFGDVDNETPTEVNPGETITHVYGEGEFVLRIVAIGVTGLKSELSRVITISFTPPSDLAADITISDTNPFEITVSPSAENATVFDILFGDEEDGAEPVTIMAEETINHMYAEAGEYTVTIVARGAGAATIEITQVVTISGNAEPIVLPITFDDATVNYAFGTFNGASYEIVDNPDLSGANTEESKVGAITNSGAQFEGGAFNLGTPVDFSGDNKTITMKFWSTSALPVLLKFEGGVNGDERQNEVVANHGGTGWEDLSFNFATDATKSFIDGSQGVGEPFVPTGQYATMVIFIDGPGTTAGTFYLDDIAQMSATTSPLALPISFDAADVAYDFGTFNGASYEVVDNPDLAGANTAESKVGAITNSGAQFEGGVFELDTPVDFSTEKTITMKFWSTSSLPILLKFEGGVNGDERQNEVVVTHGGTGWEDLSFDFANDATKSFIDGSQGVGEPFVPTGQYASLVIFVDGPGTTSGTFYVDDIAQGAAGLESPELPVDFEASNLDYTWTGFGSVDFGSIPAGVITNPDASGINTSANVLEINKTAGAQVWAGASMNLAGGIDWSNGTTVTVKVWSPRVGTAILFKVEDSNSTPDGNGNPTVFAEVSATSTVASAWEELTFDMTSFGAFSTAESYDRVILFPDFNNAGTDELFYFDDIMQTTGGGTGSTAPTSSAPVPPSRDASDVISIFGESYTNVSGIDYDPNWGQSGHMQVNTSFDPGDGNLVLAYPNFNYQGTDFAATPQDASAMEFLHVDIWVPSSVTDRLVKITPINSGSGAAETLVTVPVTPGAWNSVDLAKADFTGMTWDAVIQMKFDGQFNGDGSANTTDPIDIYTDNIYFYKAPSTGGSTVPTSSAPVPPSRDAADVISIFGESYTNVTGINYDPDWGQSGHMQVNTSFDPGDGNLALAYPNFNYQGTDFSGTPQDASAMEFLHVDIWVPSSVTDRLVKITPINNGTGATETLVTVPVTPGAWNSVDIPIADFTGMTWDSVFQMKFDGQFNGDGSANTTEPIDIYTDNIYFYKN